MCCEGKQKNEGQLVKLSSNEIRQHYKRTQHTWCIDMDVAVMSGAGSVLTLKLHKGC
ncbi:unnamed protein product [Paramecium octaurelia]|uniref:Uncharacterized protein n=1 Tax=Paramecium octaurelia TaxID=43137 RepID=A0A8S1U2U7_PAROT|nr:unnamed protein product [Paramecium octaurelia]